jgi:hypothetical protein
LYLEQILTWADAFQARTGRWPLRDSGPIHESPEDTWARVDQALRQGLRALPGGSSLARLLFERRGVRNQAAVLPLSESQILAWADAHVRRTGDWPQRGSGPLEDAPGETWSFVDAALTHGTRGLPGGDSLRRLLARYRAVRNPAALPRLTYKVILAWADAHQARTGTWPTVQAGAITEAPGETWCGVNAALWSGCRGLRGGTTLARVLEAHRGVRNIHHLPPLTEEAILGWARAHQQRTGRWPTYWSGKVAGSGGETWLGIDTALKRGQRGLPSGSSLSKLLADRGLKHNRKSRPELTHTKILRWADSYHDETGAWPKKTSGSIRHLRGETWECVDRALRAGERGLPGGSSLAQLLTARRGVRHQGRLARFSVEQILAWADAHQARTGHWPRGEPVAVVEAPGETWQRVDRALCHGTRGLPGGSSLARLLAQRRGLRNQGGLPKLTVAQILTWADTHHARTGKWPTVWSGPIAEAPGESWQKINAALRLGLRGLPGQTSVSRLLQEKRGSRRKGTAPGTENR